MQSTRRCFTTARCLRYNAKRQQQSYGAAIDALNTLQSNFSVVDAIRRSGRGMNKDAIPEMIEWCRRTGYEPTDFDRIRPIHVAGTKGKGSTSAFVSSILSQYIPKRLRKVGLYTSPHLRSVRERMQLNDAPISEDAFARYFFETWEKLESSGSRRDIDLTAGHAKPAYFRFLTLMAFHTFLKEGVDSAVIECGVGGEYDSTNIIMRPTVTAITSLGIDHVAVLGSTLPEIAWHKAGIFKPGVPAFTSPQPESAMEVLQRRAAEKGVPLHVVSAHPELEHIRLGLAAEYQKVNASLAIAVAAAHLRSLGHEDIPDPAGVRSIPLPAEFRRGLEQVRWPGRCDIRREGSIVWHIDGGHTHESIEAAGKWFASCLLSPTSDEKSTSIVNRSGLVKQATPSSLPRAIRDDSRILIFNQQSRDATSLISILYQVLSHTLRTSHPFSHVIFCTNLTYRNAGYKPDLVSVNANEEAVRTLKMQRTMAETWRELDPTCEVQVCGTVEEAVAACRQLAASGTAEDHIKDVPVLVTGSLHLVGGVLEVIES